MNFNCLITITSCNRINLLKKHILPFLKFVNNNTNFDFIVSLDGTNNDYTLLSEELGFALLHSEKREGVGLSKNRVLTQFPNFDFYFFLDDDVELVDDSIFQDYIDVFYASGEKYHHMCSSRFVESKKSLCIANRTLTFSDLGGGYFNFFSHKALKTVGGWHTEFAQWKRYGHTEHSYRFLNNKLSEYPFISIDESINKIIIHSPDHVSEPLANLTDKETQLFFREKELISENIMFYPIKTLCNFNLINSRNEEYQKSKLEQFDLKKDMYPLIHGKEKKRAKVNYKVYLLSTSKSIISKLYIFFQILIQQPANNSFKHFIKTKLKRNK